MVTRSSVLPSKIVVIGKSKKSNKSKHNREYDKMLIYTNYIPHNTVCVQFIDFMQAIIVVRCRINIFILHSFMHPPLK